MSKQLYYVASPYSSREPAVEQQRFEAVCAFASKKMMQGHLVFSPIAHSHPIKVAGGLPGGFEFWEAFDRRMIGACDGLIVLRLEGWQNSVGVLLEIQIAEQLGKPVLYEDPVCVP